MIAKTVIVNLAQGLHVRPCKEFVKLSAGCKSEVRLGKDENRVNGKSLLELMTLGVSCGDAVELQVDGEDEEELAARLEELLTKGEA